MRYSGGVEEAGSSLDKVSFSRDGEKGGCVLLFIAIANILSDCEEVGVAAAFLISGIGSVGDGVFFGRDVGGAGSLTDRLSHSLGVGMVSAVIVATETGVLECVFSLRGMDVVLRRPIEANGLSFDDLGVGRRAEEGLIGGVELERSQFTTF